MKWTIPIVVLAVAAVAVTAGVVYALGVPQQGAVASSAVLPDTAADAAIQPAPLGQAPAQSRVPPRDAAAPPPDPSVPLAIEIPGCVCHSGDPKVVEEHAAYRMNQCAGCHVGGVPTGQR